MLKTYICKHCSYETENVRTYRGHCATCRMDPRNEARIRLRAKNQADILNSKNPIIAHKFECKVCGKPSEKMLRKTASDKIRERSENLFCSIFCSRKYSRSFASIDKIREGVIRFNLLNNNSSYIERTEEGSLRSAKKDRVYVKKEIPIHSRECINCGIKFSTKSTYRKTCSRHCQSKWRWRFPTDKMKNSRFLKGGYRENSGRGKYGYYKEFQFQSTYEFYWLVWAIDKGIQFQRNTEGFSYEYLGKIFKYFPDFILEDGSYVEIKGYIDEKTKVKLESFSRDHKLTVLLEMDLKEAVEYVTEQYGKDYIQQFLNTKHLKSKNNICKSCGNLCYGICCSRSCAGKSQRNNKGFGCIWINDGIINRIIGKEEEIPEGFKRGRINALVRELV